MAVRASLAQALLSDLSVVIYTATQAERLSQEYASPTSADYTTPRQERAKRNRLRKSWPELASILDQISGMGDKDLELD